VVLFFVRVILFFMSRTADDVEVPKMAEHSEVTRADHRPTSHYDYTSSKAAQSSDDLVTRDEMMKLFGGALRVR
jgi:hypothetical protein